MTPVGDNTKRRRRGPLTETEKKNVINSLDWKGTKTDNLTFRQIKEYLDSAVYQRAVLAYERELDKIPWYMPYGRPKNFAEKVASGLVKHGIPLAGFMAFFMGVNSNIFPIALRQEELILLSLNQAAGLRYYGPRTAARLTGTALALNGVRLGTRIAQGIAAVRRGEPRPAWMPPAMMDFQGQVRRDWGGWFQEQIGLARNPALQPGMIGQRLGGGPLIEEGKTHYDLWGRGHNRPNIWHDDPLAGPAYAGQGYRLGDQPFQGPPANVAGVPNPQPDLPGAGLVDPGAQPGVPDSGIGLGFDLNAPPTAADPSSREIMVGRLLGGEYEGVRPATAGIFPPSFHADEELAEIQRTGFLPRRVQLPPSAPPAPQGFAEPPSAPLQPGPPLDNPFSVWPGQPNSGTFNLTEVKHDPFGNYVPPPSGVTPPAAPPAASVPAAPPAAIPAAPPLRNILDVDLTDVRGDIAATLARARSQGYSVSGVLDNIEAGGTEVGGLRDFWSMQHPPVQVGPDVASLGAPPINLGAAGGAVDDIAYRPLSERLMQARAHYRLPILASEDEVADAVLRQGQDARSLGGRALARGSEFSANMVDRMARTPGRVGQLGRYIRANGQAISTGGRVAFRLGGAALATAGTIFQGVRLSEMHKMRNELRGIAHSNPQDQQIQEFFKINDEATKRNDAYFGVNTALATAGVVEAGAVAATAAGYGGAIAAGIASGPVGWTLLGLGAFTALFTGVYEHQKQKQAHREYLQKIYGNATNPSLDYYLDHKDPELLKEIRQLKYYEAPKDAPEEFKKYVDSMHQEIAHAERAINIEEGVDDPRRRELHDIVRNSAPYAELDYTADFIRRNRAEQLARSESPTIWTDTDILQQARLATVDPTVNLTKQEKEVLSGKVSDDDAPVMDYHLEGGTGV